MRRLIALQMAFLSKERFKILSDFSIKTKSAKASHGNCTKAHVSEIRPTALHAIVHQVPFGILCFAPSYPTLDKLLKRWKVGYAYADTNHL